MQPQCHATGPVGQALLPVSLSQSLAHMTLTGKRLAQWQLNPQQTFD
jgi:hypothetical protein